MTQAWSKGSTASQEVTMAKGVLAAGARSGRRGADDDEVDESEKWM
jgi:hypothetical protein